MIYLVLMAVALAIPLKGTRKAVLAITIVGDWGSGDD